MTRDTFDRFQPPQRGLFGDNEHAARAPRVTGRSDIIDLTLAIHVNTGKAILASTDGEEAAAAWLPVSLVEVERTGSFAAGHFRSGRPGSFPLATVSLPERLAQEKGLI